MEVANRFEIESMEIEVLRADKVEDLGGILETNMKILPEQIFESAGRIIFEFIVQSNAKRLVGQQTEVIRIESKTTFEVLMNDTRPLKKGLDDFTIHNIAALMKIAMAHNMGMFELLTHGTLQQDTDLRRYHDSQLVNLIEQHSATFQLE